MYYHLSYMKVTVTFALLASACLGATGPVQLSRLPLAFEPNTGQSDPQVKYLAHAPHATVWLTERGAVLGLGKKAVQMHFEGANKHPKIAAEDRWAGVSNYYAGNNPSQWRSGVPHFGKVRYSDVYPGISAVFYGNPSDLEYDFDVNPGADPSTIRLAFDGADSVTVDSNGVLVLEAGEATIKNLRPAIRQNGRTVDGHWVLRGKREAGFVVDTFDRSKKLTIDPVLTYGTYLGGQNYDAETTVALDSQGNIIVGGYSESTNFPLANAFDSTSVKETPNNLFTMATFSKINPSATGSAQLVYSTYYASGGTVLPASATTGVAVDSGGNAYFTGLAGDNLPVMNPLPNQSTYLNNADCFGTIYGNNENGNCLHTFVAEVSPTGSLMFSTYLGGSDLDWANAIAVDATGNIYTCGWTESSDFPITANAVVNVFQESNGSIATVTMISGAAGSRKIGYSTFLGGPGQNACIGLAADGKGNIYAVGDEEGTGFQTTANAYQTMYLGGFDTGYAVILNTTAKPSLVYSTLLGANGATYPYSVAIDPEGNIISVGQTAASEYPQTGTPQTFTGTAAFVSKLNPHASGSSQLVFSTVLGNGMTDASSVALDPAGHIWIGGYTNGTIPTTANAFQPYQVSFNANGSVLYTGFIAEIDPTQSSAASVLYSSTLGGTETFVNQIALDPTGQTLVVAGSADSAGNFGSVYPAKFSGAGGATTFSGNLTLGSGPPLTTTGFQTTYGGMGDGYIATFNLTQTGPLMTTIENGAGLGAQPILTLSPGLIFTIKGSALGPSAATGGAISNNVVTNNLDGVQVLVDGNPCPLLYLSETQINTIAPYEISAKAGGMVPVQVVYNGVPGNIIYMPVQATNPGLFSYDDGSGQGAILNQDQTRNGASNAAARGTIATFFATGEGQTIPPGVDGALANEPAGGIPVPVASVSMTIGGVPVTNFPYVGTVPTGVAGALQIDATIPMTVAPGTSVPVVLTIGGNSSPNTLTMAVQ